MRDFRTTVLEWLARRGWSQARLSEETGISQSLISKWLAEPDTDRRRVTPSPLNLKRLAPVLGITYDDLLHMCGYRDGGEEAAAADDFAIAGRARWTELVNVVRKADERNRTQLLNAVLEASISSAKIMVREYGQNAMDASVPGRTGRPRRGTKRDPELAIV